VSATETRGLGAGLALAVDALFFGAALFIYASVRSQVGTWPDPPYESVAATLPLLAAGMLVVTALLHRARYRLLPLAGAVATLVVLAAFFEEAASCGLSLCHGRYGPLVLLLTAAWASHILGGLVALGLAAARRRTAAQTPLLGRYLAFQAGVGLVLVPAVFLW
jgi:heme/copper-type cytochrome/quinol oxidase subunit 3